MHYRRWDGPGRPLLMFHANPGSTRMLLPLIAHLAAGRTVIAFDTPGLGQSDPLDMAEPDIGAYAARMLDAVDSFGLEAFDLYGTHTGANIAVEIAIARPSRSRRLILDGISLYDDEARRVLLERYARPPVPNLDGSHILWAWHFVRDQWCFWPWFRRESARRRTVGLPDPAFLNEVVVDVLDNLAGVAAAYRASFVYPKDTRLPLVGAETLILSATSDIFFPELQAIASCLPSASVLALDAPHDDPAEELRLLARTCIDFLTDDPARHSHGERP